MDRRYTALGSFLVLAILWGFSFPAISVGLRSLDPILFASFRYDIAAVLLVGLGITRTRTWIPTKRADLGAVLAGGLFLVASNALLFVGQQTVSPGVAAVLQGLVPIATTLWALGILPEERVSAVGAVGIALGFLGVGLVVRPDPTNVFAGDTAGKLLILGQVAGVALGGVLVQRFGPTLDRAALSGWSMALGAVVLHAVSLAIGEPFGLPDTVSGGLAVVYLGVFATAVAFFIYYTLLEVRGALETSLVAYAVPVVATVVSAVFFGDAITPLTVLGFVVVFSGFLVLKRQAIADLVGGSIRPASSE